MRTHPLGPEHAAIVRSAINRGERDVWLTVPADVAGDESDVTRYWTAPLPWADPAKSCETCGATGFRKITHVGVNGKYQGQPCPDCRDGLPLVELRAACPWCKCNPCLGLPDCNPAFMDTGTVRLAVATVEVEPDPDDPRMYQVRLTLEDQ